jgi:hypothetical protein
MTWRVTISECCSYGAYVRACGSVGRVFRKEPFVVTKLESVEAVGVKAMSNVGEGKQMGAQTSRGPHVARSVTARHASTK